MKAVIIKDNLNSSRNFIIFDEENDSQGQIECYQIINNGIDRGTKGYNSSYYCDESNFFKVNKTHPEYTTLMEKALNFSNKLIAKYLAQLKLFKYD